MKKLLQYAGKYKYLTYASWILSAASSLIALLPFIYIWKIVKEVINEPVNVTHYGWMAVVFAVVALLVYIGGLLCSHLAAFRVQTNIRKTLMRHIVKLPLGCMDEIGSGKIRKTVFESSAATETYLAHQLPDRAGAIATPIGLIALLIIFDWRLGLLSLIPVALSFTIMASMTGKKMKTKMKEYQNALDSMSNEAVEYVRGIPVVKTFGQTVFSFKKFKASINNYEKWVISYTKNLRIPMMLYTTLINAVFAVLIVAALVITRNNVTNTDLLNIIFYIIITPVITVTLTKIMYSSENKMIVQDAMSRIDEILAMKPLIRTTKPQEPEENSIILNNVSFAYSDDGKNAVSNVSILIKPGEHVAFVGPSGGGKSTIAGLTCRFFDVTQGEILIGGVNVKKIAKEKLMDTVAFVFQDSHLLKKSILENVRMARPDASDADVIQALHDAQCDDIIDKFPEGVHTVIGTNGIYVSGGEQQRISIARVMLKNSPILILDEATAFADPDNEVLVQKALSKLSEGKTVLMIAHRLSTVVNTDRIFVVKDGSIVESGSHDSLCKQEGLYKKMWNEYNKAASWKVGGQND